MGWSVWWDRQIVGGSHFDEATEEAIAAAKVVAVLWSRASVTSPWVRAEAAWALDRDKLLPVKIDDVDLPLQFFHLPTIDLVGWNGARETPAMAQLIADLAQRLGDGEPKADRVKALAKVFISYRRDDSAPYAGRIQDRLERELGRDLLFIDVDSIPLGANFVKVLRDEVAQCGVLVAVIGPNWLDVRDEDGARRLDNPTDFVRVEIAAALQREIPVIPIFLDGTRVPKADQLPEELRELALRNGLNVRHGSMD
jgi:hypothetical protein